MISSALSSGRQCPSWPPPSPAPSCCPLLPPNFSGIASAQCPSEPVGGRPGQMLLESLNLRTAIPLSFSPVYGWALSFTK